MKLNSSFNVLPYTHLIDKLKRLEPIRYKPRNKPNPLGVFQPKSKAPQGNKVKLNEHQLNQIKYLGRLGISKTKLGMYFNVSYDSPHKILNGTTYTWHLAPFEFIVNGINKHINHEQRIQYYLDNKIEIDDITNTIKTI